MVTRQIRVVALLSAILALAIVVLAIPDFTISLFGNSFSRGDDDTLLGLSYGLDLRGGTHLVYRAVSETGQPASQEDLEVVRTIIDRRVNEFGVSEATVQLLGLPPDRVLVQIPGQSGDSITMTFSGDLISSGEVEDFFRDELGRTDARADHNDDGSITVDFDEVKPDVVNAQGDVIEEGDAKKFQREVEERFPVSILIAFNPDPIEVSDDAETPDDGATPEDEDAATATPTPLPEDTFPTLEEVRAAFDAAGRDDAAITENSSGFYTADLIGLLPQGTNDDDTARPAEELGIQRELRNVGDLAAFLVTNQITQWTAAGGVEEAKRLIGTTARLEFWERLCGTDPETRVRYDATTPPDGIDPLDWVLLRCTDPAYFGEIRTDIDAADLTDASAGTQPGVPRPGVNININGRGADAFFDVTDRISRTGDRLVIRLDGDELISPSAGQGITGGRAFIQGPDFTAERARTIAIQVRSGSLPVDLELVQERNVDATLGQESLRKSLIAGVVGLAMLIVFMISYYKVPGLVASVTLVIYTIVLLAIFKLIPVTLTLAGGAAIVLSLGFAVDANILIAERVKEELRTGRQLLPAINAGFDRAWPSIRDGNISTIITAAVLFWFGDRFGTSIIQGFALTLGVGVLLSMLTAFFVSRMILRFAARTTLGGRTSLFVPVRDASHEEPAVGS